MTKQLHAKQERVVEAIRQGLEGDAAVEFVHQSGYAITPMAMVRTIKSLGGRGNVQDLIQRGHSNVEILKECLPNEDLSDVKAEPPKQVELFELEEEPVAAFPVSHGVPELYATTKMTLTMPSDLYEAIRLAAKVEGKAKNQLIVDILTAYLSRVPALPEEDSGIE